MGCGCSPGVLQIQLDGLEHSEDVLCILVHVTLTDPCSRSVHLVFLSRWCCQILRSLKEPVRDLSEAPEGVDINREVCYGEVYFSVTRLQAVGYIPLAVIDKLCEHSQLGRRLICIALGCKSVKKEQR